MKDGIISPQFVSHRGHREEKPTEDTEFLKKFSVISAVFLFSVNSVGNKYMFFYIQRLRRK